MNMKLFILALLVGTSPVMAQDTTFAEGSQAKSWNLYAEEPALFEATVVDLLCEIAGDCAENCGNGDRQLALLRSADGVLVYPNKNSQAAFTGASAELLPFCGQTIEVDGLLITDEDLGAQNVYLLQLMRPAGSEEWIKANSWTKVWAEKNPEAAGKGPWFRRDPRVLAEIAEHGYFGLGLEEDAAIKAELWP
ncbi:hypothetical protein N9C96_00460 [bacterium]|nr:hypothetical protein [bacterium]